MDFKRILINHALLGTEKKVISTNDIPEPLQAIANDFADKLKDKETQFLGITAVAFNCYKAGFSPSKTELIANVAPNETLSYCSLEASNLLTTILANNYQSLTWLWVELCAQKGLIVPPNLLTEFFQWGLTNKKTSAESFVKVIGERGKWLAQFEKDWNSIIVKPVENIEWETASSKDRIRYLEKLRQTEPNLALDKIKAIWKEENAAHRVELLGSLATNLNLDDEDFLQSCIQDKSTKVKEKSIDLLKSIASSHIILQYQKILANSFTLSQSKILGILSKKSVVVELKIEDDTVFLTGIEKLSNDKKIKDEDFILYQLVAEAPPHFWTVHFSMSPQEVIELFDNMDQLAYFRVALCKAIHKFKLTDWSILALERFGRDQHYLLELLDLKKLFVFALPFLKNQLFDYTIQLVLQKSDYEDWPYNFSKAVVQDFAKNLYWNNRATCEALSLYLPSTILSDLDNVQQEDEYRKTLLKNMQNQFRVLIELKEQIKKAI